MSRNYKPKLEKKYSKGILQAALQALKDGETLSATAYQFNMPQTSTSNTFYKWSNFSKKQEKALV